MCGTHTHAEIALGDLGALGFGIDANVRATSNLVLDNSEEDDVVYTAMPKAVFRSEGATSIEAFVGLEVLRFDDLDKNDSENFKSGIVIQLPNEADGENYYPPPQRRIQPEHHRHFRPSGDYRDRRPVAVRHGLLLRERICLPARWS